MKSEESDTATGMSEETEPVSQAAEQAETENQPGSLNDALLKLAAEDGHVIGDAPVPESATEPTAEAVETEPKETETETEPEPEEKEETEKAEEEETEEEKGEPKKEGEKLVPLSEVLDERAKKRRANERADKAEALAAQLQAQLAQATAPVPTEDQPFIDIQDLGALDRLERSYEKVIDLADENPDGVFDYEVDGKKVDLPPEKLAVMKRKAEKAIRKLIPDRRTYLQQRAQMDAAAIQAYPELSDPETDFSKMAQTLAYNLLTGKAQSDPTLLVWVARAIKGYQEELKRNGKETPAVKSTEAKKILDSAKTKIAPAPVRTRQFVERGTSSASLEKATKRFEERGDAESAEELVGALLNRSTASKHVEPVAR